MTYIGSVKDAEKAMSDERRVEQERIEGFCPEGVEDFANRWFGAIEPYLVVPRSAPTSEAQRIAALEAELAAARAAVEAATDQALALMGQTPEAAQHPLKRAVAAWPGYGGLVN